MRYCVELLKNQYKKTDIFFNWIDQISGKFSKLLKNLLRAFFMWKSYDNVHKMFVK